MTRNVHRRSDGWVLVGPEEAKQLLETSTLRNRSLKADLVRRFAKDMLEGRWIKNGEPVIFDRDGCLLDGQHRLNAIVKSGVSLELYFIFVDEDPKVVLDSIDTGSARTGRDRLVIHGVKRQHAGLCSAFIRVVIALERGSELNNSRLHADNGEVREFYERNERRVQRTLLIVGASEIKRGLTGVIPSSLVAALHYMVALDHQTKVDKFVESLATGLELRRSNPVYLLRCLLLRYRMKGATIPHRLSMGLLIKTWNFYLNNIVVKNLKFDQREAFPEVMV